MTDESPVIGEKEALERAAFDYFARCYNADNDVEFKFLKFGKEPEPDIVCSMNGKEVGIEIAHLFKSQLEARRLLDKATMKDKSKKERIKESTKPLSFWIPEQLNTRLERKARKKYSLATWLVIRNANPLWQKVDFEVYRDRIKLPEIHPFEEIWLVCDQKGDSGILRLHP